MADIIIFENASVLRSGVSGTSNDLSGTLTTNDEGKYVLAIDENTNLSDLVVEIEPTISNYSVTNPSGSDVQVIFDSDEQLGSNSGDIAVPIEDSGTNVVVTLSRTDFSESGNGPYTYTATYTVSSDDTYTATLDTAKDPRGNDYGGSLSASTTVDTTAPTWDVNISASGGDQQLDVSGDYPPESDLTEVRFYRAQTSGFTPDSGNLLTTITSPTPDDPFTINDNGSLQLSAPNNGTTYYYKAQADDDSGNTSTSNEASATPQGSTYDTVVTNDNPYHYWRCDEVSGSNLADEQNNIDLFFQDVAGKEIDATSIVTDSSSAIASTGAKLTAAFQETAFESQDNVSVEFWIKPRNFPSSSGHATIFAQGAPDTSTGGIEVTIDDQGNLNAFDSGGDNRLTFSITTGTVYHVVVVHDFANDNFELWVNGTKQDSATGLTSPSVDVNRDPAWAYVAQENPSRDSAFGISFLFEQPDAIYDELAMYRQALSSTQIQNHYDAGK